MLADPSLQTEHNALRFCGSSDPPVRLVDDVPNMNACWSTVKLVNFTSGNPAHLTRVAVSVNYERTHLFGNRVCEQRAPREVVKMY